MVLRFHNNVRKEKKATNPRFIPINSDMAFHFTVSSVLGIYLETRVCLL